MQPAAATNVTHEPYEVEPLLPHCCPTAVVRSISQRESGRDDSTRYATTACSRSRKQQQAAAAAGPMGSMTVKKRSFFYCHSRTVLMKFCETCSSCEFDRLVSRISTIVVASCNLRVTSCSPYVGRALCRSSLVVVLGTRVISPHFSWVSQDVHGVLHSG